jgi:hypothetical protein
METLELAKTYWEQGEPLPLDLAVELMAQGFDVEALEQHYYA